MRGTSRILVLAAAVLMCGASLSNKPNEKQSKSVEGAAPELRVGAADILKGHDENGLRWDQTYRNKVVEVTGVIKGIEHSALSDDPVITIEPPKVEGAEEELILERVSCYLADSQVKKALDLKVGQSITVKGRVKGWALGPDITPCVLP